MKSLVKNPLADLFKDDSFFSGLLHKDNVPAINIKQTENAYEMDIVAPGIKKEGFKLEVDNGLLTVTGLAESSTENDTGKYYRKEYSFESFSRQFILPEGLDTDKIAASYADGVLKVTLPRQAEEKTDKKKTVAIV
ncbi:Hsp20/alpha crystallin family protein [Emticicia sp. 21SJ11W-3]|uniref:Hsp20/alpha crystallin family protein n=1 Tax=Emticicia sp. 21SJ11W-3 TaxID=2916755 RepID=UPI00209CD3E7|nr:Hsp20/alpha crystallin family protein [Emticicia sp. 21SJ11W-3]UTA66734.1 Hsp20/alpha crystallin family protein [Emticicia sp. 21SJ11W-3]